MQFYRQTYKFSNEGTQTKKPWGCRSRKKNDKGMNKKEF